MPLDAICLRALTNELKGQLLDARIDKVQQPARDQIVLLLRGNLRLLINAGPNQPRVQLTEVLRENPTEPPMLCMLLRKHLVGGRITEIEQSGLERIVTFTVRSVNELGESGTKKLVLEAMGRRSNLLLLDEDDRILDCMRRVEFEVSGARALLPGLYYQLPTPLDKLSLLTDPEGTVELARRGGGAEETVEQSITRNRSSSASCSTGILASRRSSRASWRFAPLAQPTPASRTGATAVSALPRKWNAWQKLCGRIALHRPCSRARESRWISPIVPSRSTARRRCRRPSQPSPRCSTPSTPSVTGRRPRSAAGVS